MIYSFARLRNWTIEPAHLQRSREPIVAVRIYQLRVIVLLAAGLLASSCSPKAQSAVDREVTTLGTTEVSARLVEIPGPFPANDLYDYAYVFRYRVLQVHRGKLEGNDILVAQYNPLKPRASVQDDASGKVGGNLRSFRAGDVHRMALAAPLDQYWMGGIVDKYFNQSGIRYWAVWTNLESR
jgi:hypothetical protein